MNSNLNEIRSPRVLLAERNYELRSFLKQLLTRENCSVVDCSSLRELSEVLSTLVDDVADEFDLFLFSTRLLDQAVMDRICRLQQRPYHPPLVLFDGLHCERFVPVRELKIAAEIESPADTSKWMAQIRKIALQQQPDSRRNGNAVRQENS